MDACAAGSCLCQRDNLLKQAVLDGSVEVVDELVESGFVEACDLINDASDLIKELF